MPAWNDLMSFGMLFLIAGMVSFALTGFLRRYALNKNLIDMPNGRSSHTIPTPRGGGVAILTSFLAGFSTLAFMGYLKVTVSLSLLSAGVLVATIGFIDDHRHIAARWRLLVHFIAAGWLVFIFGGLPPLPVFGMTFDLTWSGYLLAALYLVWLLNLYNFMDGIDGIASIEAITTLIGAIVLYLLVDAKTQNLIPLVLLCAAVIGFLLWNFPRAKIFMGDAGSGFLGLMLGAFSIQAAWLAPKLLWGWLILLGVFLVDATITLIRRALRREKIYVAHRSHAYQHAARQLNSHVRVTVSTGLINLFWLMPIAMLVVSNHLDGIIGVVIAYIPLIVLAIIFKAGEPEANSA